MARTYQVSCPPGSKALLADMTSLGGGQSVTVFNSHATEPLYVGGDENEDTRISSSTTLSTSTGLKIPAGQAFSFLLDGNESVYGRSGTSTVTITAHVFRSNRA